MDGRWSRKMRDAKLNKYSGSFSQPQLYAMFKGTMRFDQISVEQVYWPFAKTNLLFHHISWKFHLESNGLLSLQRSLCSHHELKPVL